MKRRHPVRLSRVATYVILLLGLALIVLPLYITVATTFKTPSESAVSYFTPPKSLYLGNYQQILADSRLYTAYGNTITITLVSLLFSVLLMPAMSYAVSRGRELSRDYQLLYYFLLVGIFIPFQVRMMPLVKLLSYLNMLNPAGIIILYIAHATCESVFLYVGFLATIPQTLEEAAYIDGASTMQTYVKVILPLMRPIIATVVIRECLSMWNDFLLPLVTLNRSVKYWTLTMYQYNFQSEYAVDYNLAFSCFVLASLPIVIFYFIMQKQIIGGLTNGAVKG